MYLLFGLVSLVSILIIMDTGWKASLGFFGSPFGEVSILIIMDTGWKGCGGKIITLAPVSILIIMDTGWKMLNSFLDKSLPSFNPHHNGYGLEVVGQVARLYQAILVSILIIMDTGWKLRL